ncbi:MAG: hypothetical protein ABII10_00930 [Candidatus Paceibacterota bacterium]
MTKENKPNTEWHPPAKEIGGVDIQEYFALMFVFEILGFKLQKNKNFKNYPVFAGLEEIIDRVKEIENLLKKKKLYFYKSNGSIYADYKIMGNRFFEKHSFESTSDQFKLEITTQEALQLARKIVASWDWQQ